MKTLLWILCAGVAFIGIAIAQDANSRAVPPKRTLWFFFSPATRNLDEAVRSLRALHLRAPSLEIRPALLVEDFAALAKPSEELAGAVRAFRTIAGETFSLRIYDEEALAIAKQWKLEQLPAFVILDERGGRNRAFIAYGTRPNVEELLTCGN